MEVRRLIHSLRSIAAAAPHHPTSAPTSPSAPTRLCQRPRSNYSPVWPTPPRYRLLCSRCLPELLHASVWPVPPTAARRGRLLHAATASSAAGSSMSSPPLQLGPMALDITDLAASSRRHQPPRAASSKRHRLTA
jgi:hypothetical protein